MGGIWEFFGLEFLFHTLLIPVEWMPLPCYIALDFCVRIFWLVVIGRILKFIWDALPIV